MQFPARDFTNQYISASYQDVLQKYIPSDTLYVLDGLGNVLFSIPSSSIGQILITSDVTSSMTVASSSYTIGSENFVPYTGAIARVDLGNNSITASNLLVAQSDEPLNPVDGKLWWDTDDQSPSVPISSSYLSGSGIILGGIQFDTSSTIPVNQEGYIYWDNDAHTLAIKPNITTSTLQVGQESWLYYLAGEDIQNGDAIYITEMADPDDGHPVCKKAIADGSRTKYAVVAVATNDVLSGSHNFATIQGVVNNLDMSSYPAGTSIYLSEITPGGYRIGPPDEPYERVLIGYCTRQNSTVGRLLVELVSIPDSFKAFVGMVTIPTITTSSMSSSGSIVTIGSAPCTLCTTEDGLGALRTFTIPSASFALTSSFLDAQYILANYNSGSPIYKITTDNSLVDSIQTTTVYTLLAGAGGRVSYTNWDAPGTLLANKDLLRIQSLRGIEREDGLQLSYSGSRYVTVSGGNVWQGVQRIYLPPVTSSVDRLVLIAHSTSIFSGSTITQYNNTQYDNGINLATLGNNRYVTNWVYRAIGNLNTTLIQLSEQYVKVDDAVSASPPTPPSELKDVAILIGRAIFKQGVDIPYQIDSAFTEDFGGGITVHNNLIGLQGGSTNEYYHLSLTDYTNIIAGTQYSDIKTKNINYIVTLQDQVLIATGSTPITFTLPSSSLSSGKTYIFKNRNHYPMYITTPDNSTIDDSLSLTASFKNTSIHLQCSGSEWFII